MNFPHLCVDDITGAIYGRRDGYLNPRGALQGFVERARELGCTWLQDEVISFHAAPDHTMTVQTHASGIISTPALVMAAGAWAQQLATLAVIDLPVLPVRRQACYVTLPTVLGYKLPMVLDRQPISRFGTTPRPMITCRLRTVRDEPPGFNFDWDAEAFPPILSPCCGTTCPPVATCSCNGGGRGTMA